MRRDDDELDAYTIEGFCRAHSLSRSMYFRLKQQGKAPREMGGIGTRRLISREAAAEWRREREAEGAAT